MPDERASRHPRAGPRLPPGRPQPDPSPPGRGPAGGGPPLRDPEHAARLSRAMSARLPAALGRWCRVCDRAHVDEALFRMVGVSGVWAVAPRAGRGMAIVRLDQWLGKTVDGDRTDARAELLRRYLRCFGP